MMCAACWEPRHPLDFYKSRNDVHKLPWTRSDNNGIDVGPTYTYPPGYDPGDGPAGDTPIADAARADQAILTI